MLGLQVCAATPIFCYFITVVRVHALVWTQPDGQLTESGLEGGTSGKETGTLGELGSGRFATET